MLHKLKNGTQDEGIRSRCLTMALTLQSEPWRLLPSDQHLCAISLKFFTRAPIVNVKQWKRRCEVATELSSKKSVENSVDITRFFDRSFATRLEKVMDDEEMGEHEPAVDHEVTLIKKCRTVVKNMKFSVSHVKKLYPPKFRPRRPHDGRMVFRGSLLRISIITI